MLKGLSPLLNAELLWVLASMGHGDELALVDRNFPAASTASKTSSSRLVRLDGADCTQAAEAILTLFPLDRFVPAPLAYMEVVGKPGSLLDIHREVKAVAERSEGQGVEIAGLERHAFYERAAQAYAVVQTSEARPYGCFLLCKGVILD